ncbi:30S ribosomal protein S20 [Thermoclostridium stercorarium subsp. stercorarium DSM 8532]|jgi:small subunit ribosomal protein S20|uniref:Small ribosomal subunit protein bS20 n=3 Tax=Thermoclostridium stercorarium TaxID=1510 RepID=L7VM30_THES1|nr:30S ribosomal protein S20 [Thermoclostridium stercorarium]AGC67561.1 30S ribosomal protein S20 [Thermoclostridium stercorarium subsp. stercorarium DSM 8532]AGI38610.1 ribosomal protein S20P [Thermoclostridium stercorarium subsp. stercorarium DSM 8532]ANW97985.1 30S ribosomal protein S20 [Thermoclostridium stercorarium subsp. thermolacticum DSM 2910]ANX00535.1 30S ribosomal protein S20 [Thermoclostridium stercorarium subsp. leptospartum DSM 9219]UZQ86146.1 30S ribosomal protein S20 [Thermocl
MPNTKSAIKRLRKIKVRTARNKAKRSELKTAIRRFNEALANNSPNTEQLLRIAIKKLDKAAAKNLIHKNKASRKKSQLMKAFYAAQVAKTAQVANN